MKTHFHIGRWLIAAVLLVTGFAGAQNNSKDSLATSDSQNVAAAEGIAPITLIGSKDGAGIFVAEAAKREIVALRTSDGTVSNTAGLPTRPNGLALSPDGSKLYVMTETPEGLVLVLNAATLKIESQWHAGHTPNAPVVAQDGRTLFVCNRFNNDVSVLDTTNGHEIARVPVQREPVAAALTPDGRTLLVANLLPNHPANGDYTGAAISVIDTASRKVDTIDLANGSTGVRGICVSPDGRFAYAVHVLAHYQLPAIEVERGWMNAAALSVLDIKTRKLMNTVLLDDEQLGAANPWDAACSADGRFLCVTHAGTHELSVIDRKALHERLDRAARGDEGSVPAANVPEDYSFLAGIRRRIKLIGNGPRGLALFGGKAYAAEYFSDSIGMAGILPGNNAPVTSIPLGTRSPMSDVRKGEMIFNDATLCRQQWQSCASCHPDARADGLNWDLLNDGIGNPKNTKSLLLAHKSPPSMWLGVRKSAEEGVRAGFRFILFHERPEQITTSVDAYLKSLAPVPSPHLVDGRLSESAGRGKKIFARADCVDCHSSPLFTNRTLHDMGLGMGMDKARSFVVPSLVEAWRTAPYLHDGRAVTIREVITKFNPNDSHGSTSALTKQELDDLIEYILSL